jgi:hypothetical protein
MQHGHADTPLHSAPQPGGVGATGDGGLIIVDASSSRPTGHDAAAELCDHAVAALAHRGHNGPADLVYLFFTPHHNADIAFIERVIASRLAPRHIIACGAEAMLSGGF